MENTKFRVKCYVCDADMKEIPNTMNPKLHFFDCPNHCPGSQRIVDENTISQNELDENYEHHKHIDD